MEAAPVVPIPTKRRFSLARVLDHWYIACAAHELGARPLARTIFDTPLVLFRSEGAPVALLDRCAHRNVPLSLGFVEGERLVCGYHGWAFDHDGACRDVPALCGAAEGKARRVPRFATREQHGFVWVYMRPDVEPEREPYAFPHLDDARYSTVRHGMDFPGSLHATLENILDVPHTAYLHRGLFRGVKKNEITAVVRRTADRAEAEYLGEPRPTGVMGSILAPGGGTVTHFDRFILPSIAQVEYGLGDKNHLVITSALTPISDFETRLFAVATFRTVIPAPLLKAVLLPIGKKVLEQDRKMLEAQTEAVQRFGGEQYVNTDVDLLGPHILRLLRQAERGESPQEDLHEEQVRLRA
ncbi:MAG: aromatic ring-hydroxylating dioxygenase subunit alpha [Myxococcales bacterium]|nr:aromatic ring-hydroxylating dioxygenase subunit alpha [Myxococcales bacterium]